MDHRKVPAPGVGAVPKADSRTQGASGAKCEGRLSSHTPTPSPPTRRSHLSRPRPGPRGDLAGPRSGRGSREIRSDGRSGAERGAGPARELRPGRGQGVGRTRAWIPKRWHRDSVPGPPAHQQSMSRLDLEELAEIELQRDEEGAATLDAVRRPSAVPTAGQDPALSMNHPFYDMARHGILQVAGKDHLGRRVITYSCCRMPPSHELNHRRLLEYLKYTLDQHVANDYIIVYFHCGLSSQNKPSLRWLQDAYQEFDRKYKKNLKALYVVHPTSFIKALWNVFKPLISHKFGKKVTYFNHLSELREHLKCDQLVIPPEVLRRDKHGLGDPYLSSRPRVKESVVGRIMNPKDIHILFLEPVRPTQDHLPILRSATLNLTSTCKVPSLRHLDECLTGYLGEGLRSEGLFRRSASVQTVSEIQRLYNQGKPVNFDDYGDIHVPATILKTFLRELPQPLLTFEAYEQVLGITSVESSLRVAYCRQILQGLPEHHRAVLGYLVGFLHEVSRESIFNRMNSSSLACVFGLNLIWPSQGAASLSSLVPLNLFTELLIEHHGKVFSAQDACGELGAGLAGPGEQGGPSAGGLAVPTVPPSPSPGRETPRELEMSR
ncbi:rho GTPase-activating protein 8 [Pteropus vampyrus]|uniref:Rho GTPase-activating protein 8 n=1 Tax=Pteropus vampyrus TaxID=132908 RepID=A0A6P6BM16_PTEVA|nr:rho GTPase-activating protein 8 [Pteropus vampyrus]